MLRSVAVAQGITVKCVTSVTQILRFFSRAWSVPSQYLGQMKKARTVVGNLTMSHSKDWAFFTFQCGGVRK